MKKLLLIAALISATQAVVASELPDDAKTVALADGNTLYIFKDAKMAMADRVGRTLRMKPGHVMPTADGKTVEMMGDEVMRLERLLRSPYLNG